MPLTVALPRERRGGERRVALVPAAAARLLAREGVSVRIESGAGRAAGFHDAVYDGCEVVGDFAGVVAGADLVVKVRMPSLEEIAQLAPGTVLVTLTRAFAHLPEIAALASGGITTVAMDLVPRTARARSMDALSSQATVAGYKAALLAAELSPRLFPMMTTAAGTIRPSRVVVIGAGVAGLQAIATARRLGAEVEAYDIRARARERIESLGARMIDTGVEGTDATGRARALRRDELRRQHDVLAERLARAHAVICAASIPNRPAPRIVTRDMVEGMLPDTVIVDVAASSGGNCELTRPGEHVRFGDTLVAGPLNLPSHGAVHASEMYARNVTNLLALVIGAGGEIVLDHEDDIIARCVLTHAGEVCHPSTATLMERPAHPFGDAPEPSVDEAADVEAGWVSEPSETASGEARTGAAGKRSEAVDDEEAAAGDGAGANPVADSTTGASPGEAAGGVGRTGRDGATVPGAAAVGGGRGGDGGRAATSSDETRASGDRAASDASPDVEPSDGTSSDGAVDDPCEEEAAPDDLTVIDGIGPALQERLYAFGFTRLSMLAELDEPARRRLAVQLELDEEIEEADWAGQARARLPGDGRTEGTT